MLLELGVSSVPPLPRVQESLEVGSGVFLFSERRVGEDPAHRIGTQHGGVLKLDIVQPHRMESAKGDFGDPDNGGPVGLKKSLGGWVVALPFLNALLMV